MPNTNYRRILHGVAHRTRPYLPQLAARINLSAELNSGEPELHLVKSMADPAKISLDIGANIGIYSQLMRRYSASVVAFEPNPVVAAIFSASLPDVRLERCAIGAEEGVAILQIPVAASGQRLDGYASLLDSTVFEQTERVEVPVRRLDDFCLTNVGMVKIDVEGFEKAVLDGGWETISRDRPAMIIEIQADHAAEPPAIIVERLAAIGYHCSFWHDGRLKPFSEWSPAMLGHHGMTVGNFIFRL